MKEDLFVVLRGAQNAIGGRGGGIGAGGNPRLDKASRSACKAFSHSVVTVRFSFKDRASERTLVLRRERVMIC